MDSVYEGEKRMKMNAKEMFEQIGYEFEKEYAVGEDDGEEYYFNFKPKYCPNCGSKIID